MIAILGKCLKSQTMGITLAFVVLCVGLGGVEFLLKENPVFFKTANLLNILLQTSINTIIAVGMTFVIITAGIDLSVGSLLALCNVIFGLTMLQFQPDAGMVQICVGIIITLLIGSAVGLSNGFISVKWSLPPFIVTLGMLGVARGFGLWLIDSQTENLIGRVSPEFVFIGNGNISGIPFPAIIAIVIIVIAHFILRLTVYGKHVTAIGSNEEAARLCGINVGYVKISVYIICGFLAGIAAIVQTSRLGSANPTIGAGFELYAIAAVIIGGTNLLGGYGTIIGTLVGALIIGVLNNGLTLMNIPDEMKQIIIGFVIIVAVLLDRIRHKRKSFG
jgi:ribose/xylose/arabinose/galactoside ABC-type transport system permease subunit